MLIDLVAPHTCQFGFGGQSADSSSSATPLGHRLDASGLGFGNQALKCHLGVRGGFGGGLLMDGELFVKPGMQISRTRLSLVPSGLRSRQVIATSRNAEEPERVVQVVLRVKFANMDALKAWR